uniref:Uncharacterized protein n=1 Tax=Lepeophtheirus salmonis TaxID=72036 RepID=A0A0K2T3M3_LEPSM
MDNVLWINYYLDSHPGRSWKRKYILCLQTLKKILGSDGVLVLL